MSSLQDSEQEEWSIPMDSNVSSPADSKHWPYGFCRIGDTPQNNIYLNKVGHSKIVKIPRC